MYRQQHLAHQARTISGLSSKDWLKRHISAPQAGITMPPNLPMRQRRIIYRSRNRGLLELDILLGGWAAKYVPSMDEAQVSAVEVLLDADTPDVLHWIMGQEAPPESCSDEIMRSLRRYAEGEGLVGDR